jgi:hypothetical protein
MVEQINNGWYDVQLILWGLLGRGQLNKLTPNQRLIMFKYLQ